MVAIVYYLSLVIDVAVLGADSTNLRVGWPGLVNLLLLDVVALVSLWHPLHDSIPATFDSPSISKGFWQLIWLFPFVSSAIVVWCMPADNSTLHRGGGLFLFHGVGVFPHLVHDSAVGPSARGPQATAL